MPSACSLSTRSRPVGLEELVPDLASLPHIADDDIVFDNFQGWRIVHEAPDQLPVAAVGHKNHHASAGIDVAVEKFGVVYDADIGFLQTGRIRAASEPYRLSENLAEMKVETVTGPFHPFSVPVRERPCNIVLDHITAIELADQAAQAPADRPVPA